jgi:hypothetical protein
MSLPPPLLSPSTPPQPLPGDIDYEQTMSNDQSVISVITTSPSGPPSKITTDQDLILLKPIDNNLSHNTGNNRYDDVFNINHSNLDIYGHKIPRERILSKSIFNSLARNYDFKSCKANDILHEYGGNDGESIDCDGDYDDINDDLIGLQSIDFYHYGGDDDDNGGGGGGGDDGDNGNTVAFTSNKCDAKPSIVHSRVVVYGKEMVLDSSEDEDVSTSSKEKKKRRCEYV